MNDTTSGVDYRRWSELYSAMPLFLGIEAEDVVELLEAIAPPLCTVRAGTSILDDYDPSVFYLCVGSDRDPTAPAPDLRRASFLRQGRWSQPSGPIGTPGLVAGEIMTLSECDPGAGPRSEWPLLDYDVHYLTFSMDDIVAVRPELCHAQHTMMRNLMGVVAQIVIDTRALFYKARYGIDMFDLPEERKGDYIELHSDPLWQE